MSRHSWFALVIAAGIPLPVMAQPAFSPVPTQAVYEFQLNYVLPWQRWYGGPGLSLGGTMPTQGAFGYSSLNGIPLPAPLGAGVYVNSPAPHAVNMPGAMPMGSGFGPQFGPNPMMMGAGPMNGLQQTTAVREPKRTVPASAPAAKRASVEQQNLGDQKLHQQLWAQAYVHYRNAADLAPERPEPHFRQGLCFTALKQYTSAVREFKRSLDLDPTLPQSGETLPTIFGEGKGQAPIIQTVADWTREDLQDTDRLFLLGLLLHFDDDPRGSEILEAARRVGGANDYLLGFLSPANRNEPRRTNLRPRRDPVAQPVREDGYPDDGIPPGPTPLLPPAPAPFPDPPPTD